MTRTVQLTIFCILTVGLELACNRGLCGEMSLKIFEFEKIPPHEPRLQVNCSLTVRIRILSITSMTRLLSHYTVQLQAWRVHCPITVSNYKHDAYNVLLVLKSGLLITNQIR